MAKTTPSKVVPTIKDIWGQTKEERESADLELNFKMLEAEGNKDLINKQYAVNRAEKALADSKMAARTNPNFTAIASAALALEAATLELTHARTTFIELFGTEPNM